jgi:hypothetical protein
LTKACELNIGVLLICCRQQIARVTEKANKERRQMESSVNNIAEFNTGQKAEIAALRKQLNELAHQLGSRTVLYEAHLREHRQQSRLQENTISGSKEENITLKAQLAQLTSQLEVAHNQRTSLEIQLKETVTIKNTLETDLAEAIRQRDDYHADLQRSTEYAREREQEVLALKGSEHFDLEQHYGEQMNKMRQDHTAILDALRRELNDANQRLTTETSARIATEQDNQRLVADLREQEQLLQQYSEQLHNGIAPAYPNRLNGSDVQTARNGAQEPQRQTGHGVRDSNNSLILRSSQDLSGRHPDDTDSILSNLTEEGGRPDADADGEVLRSSLTDVQGTQQPIAQAPRASSSEPVPSPTAAAKAGRYRVDSVRQSADSGVFTQDSGTGTDDTEWRMLSGAEQEQREGQPELPQPATARSAGRATAAGIAFDSGAEEGQGELFNAEAQAVFETFEIIADRLQRAVPRGMPTQTEFVFNELVNACVFDCGSEEAASQLFVAFESMVTQVQAVAESRLHFQVGEQVPRVAAPSSVGFVTPQHDRHAAVIHDTSTEYSPTGQAAAARPSPALLKELEHLRHQGTFLRFNTCDVLLSRRTRRSKPLSVISLFQAIVMRSQRVDGISLHSLPQCLFQFCSCALPAAAARRPHRNPPTEYHPPSGPATRTPTPTGIVPALRASRAAGAGPAARRRRQGARVGGAAAEQDCGVPKPTGTGEQRLPHLMHASAPCYAAGNGVS